VLPRTDDGLEGDAVAPAKRPDESRLGSDHTAFTNTPRDLGSPLERSGEHSRRSGCLQPPGDLAHELSRVGRGDPAEPRDPQLGPKPGRQRLRLDAGCAGPSLSEPHRLAGERRGELSDQRCELGFSGAIDPKPRHAPKVHGPVPQPPEVGFDDLAVGRAQSEGGTPAPGIDAQRRLALDLLAAVIVGGSDGDLVARRAKRTALEHDLIVVARHRGNQEDEDGDDAFHVLR
jgi:hypothetical protein